MRHPATCLFLREIKMVVRNIEQPASFNATGTAKFESFLTHRADEKEGLFVVGKVTFSGLKISRDIVEKLDEFEEGLGIQQGKT